jgi:Methylamine utilisation protein MauE
MKDPLTFVSAMALAIGFGWAAISKLANFQRWRRALRGYALPSGLERAALLGTPVLEAVAVGLILTGPLELAGALSLALLAGFSVVVLRARATQGDRLPCGCFGGTTERDYRLMLVRNAVLGLPAGALMLSGNSGLIERLESFKGSDALPLGLVLLAGGLIVWMTMGLLEMMNTRSKPSKGNPS